MSVDAVAASSRLHSALVSRVLLQLFKAFKNLLNDLELRQYTSTPHTRLPNAIMLGPTC